MTEHQIAMLRSLNTPQTVAAADEIERLREALFEIAMRAGNMHDDDAVTWMPSIYKIACEAVGEKPRLLPDQQLQRGSAE